MSMSDTKFCTGCGRELEPGMQFCPQCGRVVAGSEAETKFKEQIGEASRTANDIRRTWLIFFLLIYAIPVIIAGLYALIDASSLADSVWASSEFQSWIDNHNLNYDRDDVKTYITVAAALITLSGLCAIGSSVCIYKKQRWVVAVILCCAAAILCFWSIFGMIIGFLMTWLIADSKDLFEN